MMIIELKHSARSFNESPALSAWAPFGFAFVWPKETDDANERSDERSIPLIGLIELGLWVCARAQSASSRWLW